jgi:hypothetical protein
VLFPLHRACGFGRNDCEPVCAAYPLRIPPKSPKAGVWKTGSAPCSGRLPAGRGDCALPTEHFPASSCGATAFWNIRLLSNVTILIWGFSQLHRDHMPSAFESARRWQQFAEEASSIARQMNDPEAIQIMRRIVQRYEILAEYAKKRALRDNPKNDLE